MFPLELSCNKGSLGSSCLNIDFMFDSRMLIILFVMFMETYALIILWKMTLWRMIVIVQWSVIL